MSQERSDNKQQAATAKDEKAEKIRKILTVAGGSANFAGMMIAIQDPDNKGLDDKIARVVSGIGTGCARLVEGDIKNAAGIFELISSITGDVAKQLRSGVAPQDII